MKLNTSNCLIYSRVSTDQQSNESAIQDLKDYAKYMKFDVLAVFEEKISGTVKTIDRIAFNELSEFVEKNDVQNILVWEISRMSRRGLRSTFEIIEYFTEKKVNIYAKKENVNTLNPDKSINHTSNLILGIMSSLAQYERISILERTKRGLHFHLRQGGAFSLSPYGYQGIEKKIAIEPDESKIVKRIFEMFINGLASPAISKRLNYEQISTKKGVKWSDTQIRDILHNTMYYGDRVYTFGIVKVPAIVTKADYLKAKQIFDNNSNMNQDKAIFPNYLSGLIKCGCCGLSYFQHARKNKKDFAYKCLSTRKTVTGQLTERCGNNGIGINILNSMVYQALFSVLISYDSNDKLENLKDKFSSKINKQRKNNKLEIKVIKSEIEKSEKKLKRIKQLLFNGTIKESDYIEESTLIESSIESQSNKLNELIINESNININNTSSFINGLGTYINQVKEQGLTGMTDHFTMDIGIYQYLIKELVKSITITTTTANENRLLPDVIKPIHHNRITRVDVVTIFDSYRFYTVAGFNQYNYQFVNNKLHKVGMMMEVCQ